MKKNKELVEEITKDLEEVSELTALYESKGGKILADNLVSDIVSSVEIISSSYKTLTNQEFVGYCADMKTKIDMLRAITRASKNKDFLMEALEEAIRGKTE